MAEALTGTVLQVDTPESIYNCSNCTRWLPPGTLACPECHTIVYSEHLRSIALAATAEENSSKWPEARETWKQALLWLPEGTKQYAAVEQRIALIDGRLQTAQDKKAKWMKRLGPLAPVAVFLSKAKWLIFFLSKAKFLLTFAGFAGFYSLVLGWKFGVGFAIGILIHEMGHFVAARRLGLKVDLPIFVPGLGAYVRWYQSAMGTTLEQRADIALAGPAFGLGFAVLCGAIARATGETWVHPGLFSGLAHIGAWLNLANLAPVWILDGKRAFLALNRMQRWLTLATTLIFYGMSHEIAFLLVGVAVTWRLFRDDGSETPHSKTMALYVLLLFFMGVALYLFPSPVRPNY